jgi:hypothetical protein
MAVSVRMDPLLEKELQQAADRQGISKSQFIIAAVERALGRKNPYALMVALKAEEPRAKYKVGQQPYDSVASKAALRKKLKAKHDASSVG